MNRFISWFFEPSKKHHVEGDDIYAKFLELEDRILNLEIENKNLQKQLENFENSIDNRIDILVEHCSNNNV